jgi:hypothetical protein
MREVSRTPHTVISIAALESMYNRAKTFVGFLDKGGIIHALDQGEKVFYFRPIAASGAVPILFEAGTLVRVVGMALDSGYKVLQFDSIEEMVRHFTIE